MSNPFEVLENRLNSIEDLLQQIKAKSEKPDETPESEELLTVEEAATFLKLRPQTLYVLMSRGELPFMKRSKRCYFLKSELLDYMKRGRRKSTSDIQKEAEDYDKKKKG
jgi:excisionase family DNA binding protein